MINEQIADFLAEKVMGWHKEAIEGYQPYWEDAQGKMQITCDEWQPATDLNQAVQAADRTELHWLIEHSPYSSPGEWDAEVGNKEHTSTIGPADALARAVVKAAGGDDA